MATKVILVGGYMTSKTFVNLMSVREIVAELEAPLGWGVPERIAMAYELLCAYRKKLPLELAEALEEWLRDEALAEVRAIDLPQHEVSDDIALLRAARDARLSIGPLLTFEKSIVVSRAQNSGWPLFDGDLLPWIPGPILREEQTFAEAVFMDGFETQAAVFGYGTA